MYESSHSVREEDCKDFWNDYRDYENSVHDADLDERISEIQRILQMGTKAKRCTKSCNDHLIFSGRQPDTDQKKLIALQTSSAASIKALQEEVQAAKKMIMKMKRDIKRYKEAESEKQRQLETQRKSKALQIGGLWCSLQEEQAKLVSREEDLKRREGILKLSEADLCTAQKLLLNQKEDIDSREGQCSFREILCRERETQQAARHTAQEAQSALLNQQEDLNSKLKDEAEQNLLKSAALIRQVQTDQENFSAERDSLQGCFINISDAFDVFTGAVNGHNTVKDLDCMALLDVMSGVVPHQSQEEGEFNLQARCEKACKMIEVCAIIIMNCHREVRACTAVEADEDEKCLYGRQLETIFEDVDDCIESDMTEQLHIATSEGKVVDYGINFDQYEEMTYRNITEHLLVANRQAFSVISNKERISGERSFDLSFPPFVTSKCFYMDTHTVQLLQDLFLDFLVDSAAKSGATQMQHSCMILAPQYTVTSCLTGRISDEESLVVSMKASNEGSLIVLPAKKIKLTTHRSATESDIWSTRSDGRLHIGTPLSRSILSSPEWYKILFDQAQAYSTSIEPKTLANDRKESIRYDSDKVLQHMVFEDTAKARRSDNLVNNSRDHRRNPEVRRSKRVSRWIASLLHSRNGQ